MVFALTFQHRCARLWLGNGLKRGRHWRPRLLFGGTRLATVQPGDEGNRVTCDLPACKAARATRAQENGRWLFNLSFGHGTVAVTVRCNECGGTHTILFPIPPEAVP